MKNIFAILLISILCLSGCTGDRCIDADDFGFIKFVISSRYKKEELSGQQQDNQTAPWVNTGYNVNGQPLTILVKTWDYSKGDKNNSTELSSWSAWYGQENNTNTLSEFCKRLQVCQFIDGRMCTNSKDAKISNAPCLFKNGVGLYMLIAERDTNPNLSLDTQRTPKGITAHLGEPLVGYTLYDLNKRGELVKAGGISYQYEGEDKVKYVQCPLYFKILDKFYDDNNGQYRVVIKSGVTDTRPDPIKFLTNLIKAELFGDDKNKGLVRSIYKNIIKTPGYRVSVSALLTLYIMFTGFSFLIGNVNLTHTELIIRIVKVSIVSTLLSSTSSWQFFHDYLFVFFMGGVEEILRIIDETATTGPGSWSIIGLMIAPQTMAKLFSLLFVDPLGFIYIILFLIALYFIFMMVFKATIIYLTALITVGMIIIMAPIFICFMLFGITRSLFENWLRQLISYALQPIILFTGIAFISMIIRTEIYSSLGFGVCKYDFPNLGPINDIFGSMNEDLDTSLGDSIFYWWFPSPMKASKFSKTKANILVPVDHRIDDGSPDGKLCLAYQCIEERYVELPFLDIVKDVRRIDNFFSGHFVQLDGLLLIFVCVYLLSKFNDIAVSSAKFLSSTSGNLTNLQAIGQAAFAPIQQQIERPANYAFGAVKQRVDQVTEKASMFFADQYEDWMMGGVAQEALDPKAVKSSVLSEVKRTYGIDYKDVNVKAGSDYQRAISEVMETIKPDGQVKEFTGSSYAELKDHLADLKFGEGKKYDSLSKEQKKELNDLMKNKDGKTLRELASDAKFTQDFQQAYMNSHQEMSKRGVGLFGKNIAPLKSWQEMNRRVDEKRELRDKKRKNIGERIYAGYEGLKREALTAIVGKDLRDAFEGNLTGAEWEDFNYNDPRLRTHSESLKDQQISLEHQELLTKINKETIAVQEDISSPEYLAKLELQGRTADIAYYAELSNKKLAFEIYDALAKGEGDEGENPVLMGERFMREKATDTQTRNMIDSAYRIEQTLIDNDKYARRQEHYEIMREKAEANGDNQSLEYSKAALKKIEERKELIKKEVRSHIDGINQYRLGARMPKYEKND
ncbi:MAG: type IV secretion system protein [Rickettsia endosymbiont of Sergentomyia squamirostris]|uniref:Type IV secretion system protein n=1 Tax=Candidatus Tisiphia endosymbiont of Sergentomyia squamirostris TaxID=3113639 RepID=A0AAT9G9Y5_9RICK